MIIYQDTKLGFLNDVSENTLQGRIETAFLRKTGSIPSDRMGWANDYSRFCTTVLAPAKVAEEDISFYYYPNAKSVKELADRGSDSEAWDGVKMTRYSSSDLGNAGVAAFKSLQTVLQEKTVGLDIVFDEILKDNRRDPFSS